LSSLFSTNVFGPLLLTKALLPFLEKGGDDVRVLSISSVAAHYAMYGLGVYSLTKAALNIQSVALASEFKANGKPQIRFNHMDPGYFESELGTSGEFKDSDVQEIGKFVATIPAGLVRAPAHLVAKFVSFILVDVPAEEFSTGTWNVGDKTLFSRWQTEADIANLTQATASTTISA